MLSRSAPTVRRALRYWAVRRTPGAAAHRGLLACQPVPVGWDDLPARQPAFARTAETQNQVDRFTPAIDAIDRVPSLRVRGAHAREQLLNQQIDCRNYAYDQGIDMPEVTGWKWPV